MIVHVLCLLCIFKNLLCICVLEKHGKHKVTTWQNQTCCNCLVIKTFMRYAAIVKHKSIHNTLNIKVKFLCYNVNAYESRARQINMKLFLGKKQLETIKMIARALK